MRLYFDACCVNRLTDDPRQERIRGEAEAIELLIGFAANPPNVWIGSAVLCAEIARNADSERRDDAQALLNFAKEMVELNDVVISRGRELQGTGFSEFDAMHLACAENSRADVFLSTDDKLVSRANRGSSRLAVRVLNPVSFLKELQNVSARDD